MRGEPSFHPLHYSFPELLSTDYMFSIMGMRSRTIRVNTGPTVTTNSDGRMQKNIGNTSLTASLEACSSARYRAMTRM